MIRALLAGATALGVMTGAAQAQTTPAPPQVWDGVIVPQAGTCSSNAPIAWRATYRPHILNTDLPSQLMVFTNYQSNDGGLVNQSPTAQFSGAGNFNFVFVVGEQGDNTKNSAGRDGSTRTYNLIQTPRVVRSNTRFIKLTGSIINSDGSSPGLFCASQILGVFVQRVLPAVQ